MEQLTPALSNVFKAPEAGPKERGRLDVTLARAGELYEALRAGRSVEPSGVLSELRVDLALHFAREESDDYFGTVQRERPSLSHDLLALRREHTALLEQLDAVRSLAAADTGKSELGEAILHIATAFRLHEYKETDLLQESVLRDDGVGAD